MPETAKAFAALLSALVHKYGDVFSERTEYRWPSFDALRTGFDPSRRRENIAPPQDGRKGLSGVCPEAGPMCSIPFHPEEARRAVSKGERNRECIYEMLHSAPLSTPG